jgi:hypothetical protein
MKILRYSFLILLLSVSLIAESVDLGNAAFYGDEGTINIAADAAVAVRNLDSPYVMFVLYMNADKGESATVRREDIVLVHNDKEYTMAELEDIRKNYKGDSRDEEMYSHLGKEALALSDLRFFRFNAYGNFFPSRASAKIPIEQGYMNGQYGFRSNVYFKNPGFAPGDVILIKVKDEKNPGISGAVAIELCAL